MRELTRLNGKIILVAAIILLISSFACQRDNTADIAAIEKAREEIDAAWLSEDIDVIMAHCADNMIFMPPNVGRIKGEENIRNFLQGFFDQFTMTELKTVFSKVHVVRDWAIEDGTYEWTVVPDSGGVGMADRVEFIGIWHKHPDGIWKETRAIWNSALPVPEAQ